MSTDLEAQLVRGLTNAHAMEEQAIRLLDAATKVAGDQEIAAIYRAHLLQTREHARYVAERLAAHGQQPSRVRDGAMQAAAVGLAVITKAMPDTPVRLAATAFAFENHEIATYRLLGGLARRAGDHETEAVAARILEQEEAAAELVSGTFERALEVTLGEPATSPLPGVTPIGKPSEREPTPGTGHPGPQQAHETPADEPIHDTTLGRDHVGLPQPPPGEQAA
jgi:ferritin-like metal-binding protein YciE